MLICLEAEGGSWKLFWRWVGAANDLPGGEVTSPPYAYYIITSTKTLVQNKQAVWVQFGARMTNSEILGDFFFSKKEYNEQGLIQFLLLSFVFELKIECLWKKVGDCYVYFFCPWMLWLMKHLIGLKWQILEAIHHPGSCFPCRLF